MRRGARGDRRRRRQGDGDGRRWRERHHGGRSQAPWIDRVAAGSGAIAWSAGRQVLVKTPKGEERAIEVPSSAGGLAFAPKGLRLAIAHYNGATLWFPNAAAEPERLEWRGSHLAVT